MILSTLRLFQPLIGVFPLLDTAAFTVDSLFSFLLNYAPLVEYYQIIEYYQASLSFIEISKQS